MDFKSQVVFFLNFAEIKLDVEEMPEDLYQRLEAFIHDNLLHRGGTITHHGDNPDTDEEIMVPSHHDD